MALGENLFAFLLATSRAQAGYIVTEPDLELEDDQLAAQLAVSVELEIREIVREEIAHAKRPS